MMPKTTLAGKQKAPLPLPLPLPLPPSPMGHEGGNAAAAGALLQWGAGFEGGAPAARPESFQKAASYRHACWPSEVACRSLGSGGSHAAEEATLCACVRATYPSGRSLPTRARRPAPGAATRRCPRHTQHGAAHHRAMAGARPHRGPGGPSDVQPPPMASRTGGGKGDPRAFAFHHCRDVARPNGIWAKEKERIRLSPGTRARPAVVSMASGGREHAMASAPRRPHDAVARGGGGGWGGGGRAGG